MKGFTFQVGIEYHQDKKFISMYFPLDEMYTIENNQQGMYISENIDDVIETMEMFLKAYKEEKQ